MPVYIFCLPCMYCEYRDRWASSHGCARPPVDLYVENISKLYRSTHLYILYNIVWLYVSMDYIHKWKKLSYIYTVLCTMNIYVLFNDVGEQAYYVDKWKCSSFLLCWWLVDFEQKPSQRSLLSLFRNIMQTSSTSLPEWWWWYGDTMSMNLWNGSLQ